MDYFDPHIHMVSRITDDYETLAKMGCVGLSEPAFWAGFDRGTVDGFRDYFRQLTEVEPKRAAQYGIQHYCWLCINAKEAENVSLSREVIAMIPEFFDKPKSSRTIEFSSPRSLSPAFADTAIYWVPAHPTSFATSFTLSIT